MGSKDRESRVAPSRPAGVQVVAACLMLYGLPSLVGAVWLFPLWLAAARNHHYGRASFVWLELVSAIAALSAAYGLWQHRRWARIPALGVAVLVIVTLCLVAGFSVGDVGGGVAWIVAGVLLLLALASSAWFLRFVWRHT